MIVRRMIIDASGRTLSEEQVLRILKSIDSSVTLEKSLAKLNKKQLIELLVFTIRK